MATPEKAMCLLFLHELRNQANAVGTSLSKKGVKCLREKTCLGAFVNEWTMAQVAWLERLSEALSDQILKQSVKLMILEAVNTYDGTGKTRFVDYSILAQSINDDESSHPKTPGSLFIAGFSERLDRIPARSIFFPRKKLSPHEQVEIMIAVNQSCWVPGLDLASTLESFRAKATTEIISVA